MAIVLLSITLPAPSTASRTFLDLQEEVLAHGYDQRKYRPRVKVWLNEGLGKLARQSASIGFEYDVAVVISPGITTYSIPGSVASIIDVRDASGFHLTNLSRDDIDNYPVVKGAPLAYALFRGQLLIAPSPVAGTTLRVRFHGRPNRLNLDGDSTGIPTEYEDLLIHYALWHAYLAEDDPEMANVHKQEWMEGVMEFRRDTQLEDESETRQIPGMMPRMLRPWFRRP